jgi:hypothetical protein
LFACGEPFGRVKVTPSTCLHGAPFFVGTLYFEQTAQSFAMILTA